MSELVQTVQKSRLPQSRTPDDRGEGHMSRPIRVLHCPANIGANPQGLASAERELGLKSCAVCLSKCFPEYQIDEQLWQQDDGILRREWKRWQLIRRAIRHYDIVHFNFGSSMFPFRLPASDPGLRKKGRWDRWFRTVYTHLMEFRDMAWLKQAGVGIVVTYQGDDARQGDFCRERFPITFAGEVGPDYYNDESDYNKRRLIARVSEYADRIFALNPDLLHMLPEGTEFLPYASVDPRAWDAAPALSDRLRRPIVLHAPTQREVKGTRYIIDAVDRLRRIDGLEFDFMLVENMSHLQAQQHYRQADLLVDQLLAGWYGALGVELMALGKPVISYLRDDDLELLPPKMRKDLPVINANPETIYVVLKHWLSDRRSDLPEIGRHSRTYVERWHDPLKIAQRLKAVYEEILRTKQFAREGSCAASPDS